MHKMWTLHCSVKGSQGEIFGEKGRLGHARTASCPYLSRACRSVSKINSLMPLPSQLPISQLPGLVVGEHRADPGHLVGGQQVRLPDRQGAYEIGRASCRGRG